MPTPAIRAILQCAADNREPTPAEMLDALAEGVTIVVGLAADWTRAADALERIAEAVQTNKYGDAEFHISQGSI